MQKKYQKHIYKLTMAAMCMALGLILPFFTMQIPEIGNMLLPMHLPIFLCGILCGAPYGALIGAMTPLLRSLLFSRPILYPTAVSMSFELCAYGLLVGLFMFLLKKKTPLTLYLSLIGAMLGGRAVWAISRIVLLALDEIPFSFMIFLSEGFASAALGIVIQLALIPALVMAIDPAYRRKRQPTVAKTTTKDAASVILDEIERLKAQSTRVTVAIEGRAAAGKTTLAAALAEQLLAAVIHTDDYLLPFEARSDERMQTVGGHFDYARLSEEVLLPWQRGEAVALNAFNCQSGEIEERGMLPASDILIVEGAYGIHPALSFSYDLVIFCDIDKETQKSRILARNGARAERFFAEWIPREEAYFEKEEIRRRAKLSFFLQD